MRRRSRSTVSKWFKRSVVDNTASRRQKHNLNFWNDYSRRFRKRDSQPSLVVSTSEVSLLNSKIEFLHILSLVALAVLYPFTPAWKNRNIRQSRLITPDQNTIDTSNYRGTGLTAGISVCGIQYAGTSGLVIRNRHSGARREWLQIMSSVTSVG